MAENGPSPNMIQLVQLLKLISGLLSLQISFQRPLRRLARVGT
jgi:hypothetical protein